MENAQVPLSSTFVLHEGADVSMWMTCDTATLGCDVLVSESDDVRVLTPISENNRGVIIFRNNTDDACHSAFKKKTRIEFGEGRRITWQTI